MTIENRQQIRQSKSWYNPQVHQATGVIIAQINANPDEALRRLVGHAESTGLSVDAVAADVIARKITFA
ncbi:ANTAR domain-containing protein [Cryobacterium adonitolivorans]|uniref:ANTAR domain-containing protein n=1 Tax=Cryobacterium adonitolivorans TaxID=1259189 RepID=A0A4R8W877_9MICO|nr:ANTAR domain-containing protein [Cryobacterium adonitolivorans]TFC01480.1 ANTAR domain-containing protein [Cryobacterium adonitolivorans]